MDESRENIGKTWVIEDSQCARRMQGVMCGINTVTVFPSSCMSYTQQHQVQIAPTTGEIKLYNVVKTSPVMEKYQRKLINETAGIFLSLQAGINEDEDNRSFIVKKSREYRSVLQLCIMEMKDKIDSEVMESSNNLDPLNKSDVGATYDLLYKMELVLSLIEILFLDTKPGGGLLNQLLLWIRLHFMQHKNKVSQILASDQPHYHPLYWEVCYSMVLQGRLEDARLLLAKHPNFDDDAFLSIDELLQKMPVFQTYGGVTMSEFSVRWNHWQDECKARLERGEYSSWKYLETICKVLCGDEDTINNLDDLMDTWYHLMVTTLLYTNPTAQKLFLHSAAQDAITSMSSKTNITALDNLLLAVIEGDPHQVIRLCQEVLDNVWFISHLSDLLYHSLGHKNEHKYLESMREFFILDYGSELASHPSLWQVGLLYLEKSGGTQGKAMVEVVLQRLPLTDDSKARKVIQAASQRNMEDVEMSVCRVMGRRALAEGRLGAAIWWGVRSKDAAFTSHLAHQILHKYVADGEFESSSLLDNLGASMLLSDTLIFLGKYREFHSLYQDGNFKEAATLLVSLISSKLAPQYFWPVLLLDALPLLEYSKPVISSDQTYQLMYCLHNLTDLQSNEVPKHNGAFNTFKEREKEIRQALTSNLEKAIVQEGSLEE